ncbi:multidrug resistance-associated ABC transporter [Wallemia mellicola]|nr:multidrug resistance-associated ABC transporter [Wallemia mellicola]TIB87211.1 multidrug resistance-associated ABC transporter [Wallemia mellicola]TIC42559.1 multidrug resistance-associated ABC transporter [Wallemia mellicola]TIC48146.1 multidrug resistance-associated ABC transporter [Wallemia mellicola]TIC54715.1 multidrug resistance-associated ABC transporter [Wallemia mellicola]
MSRLGLTSIFANTAIAVASTLGGLIINHKFNKVALPTKDEYVYNDAPINPNNYKHRNRMLDYFLFSSGVLSLAWYSSEFGFDLMEGYDVGFSVLGWLQVASFLALAYMGTQSFSFNYLLAVTSALSLLTNTVIYLHPKSTTSVVPLITIAGMLIAVIFKKPGPDLLHHPDYDHKSEVKSSEVCQSTNGSMFDTLFFTYATPIVRFGYERPSSMTIDDLPFVPPYLRGKALFEKIRRTLRLNPLPKYSKNSEVSAMPLFINILKANRYQIGMLVSLSLLIASLYYTPAIFLKKLLSSIEENKSRSWQWYYATCLFFSSIVLSLFSGQVWSFAATQFVGRIRTQLNSLLYAKTMSRKDISAASSSNDEAEDEIEVKSKSQVMTLMTVDADRISQSSIMVFTLMDAPIELIVGSIFLYSLLGHSALIGLLVIVLFLPLNHYSGKFVVKAQDNLMEARDRRTSIMTEILSSIRIIKLAGSERQIMSRVLGVRRAELYQQKLNYLIEVAFNLIWDSSPFLVSLTAFMHYTLYRGLPLTPAIAFASVSVFNEMQFALNGLPECFIGFLQTFVSVRRIAAYLSSQDVDNVCHPGSFIQISNDGHIILRSTSFAWPTNGTDEVFTLHDIDFESIPGQLSLVCGKLGSGKTLFLNGLLGEADLVGGSLRVPRSDFNTMVNFPKEKPSEADWLIDSMVAYAPQVPWLMNASIKDNILFYHPFDEKRYNEVLDACSLRSDINYMEDGDETEIGEQGLNLSGGQKARVSLARTVYSRARTLLLDDVLSAVDSHTSAWIFEKCIKGPLLENRNVVLVSHHIQLVGQAADNVIVFDNGQMMYTGSAEDFHGSELYTNLISSMSTIDNEEEMYEAELSSGSDDDSEKTVSENKERRDSQEKSQTSSSGTIEQKTPRKLIQDETRAVGRVSKDVYLTLLKSMGGRMYWSLFTSMFVLAAVSPMVENWILSQWSNSYVGGVVSKSSTLRWISVYGVVIMIGIVVGSLRWLILYLGSIKASQIIHDNMLESCMRAPLRFYDTVSKGRLLNRFGKDLEGIDSSLADNLGRSIVNALGIVASFASVMLIGGIPAIIGLGLLSVLYYQVGKMYNTASRELRRIESVYKSPVYSLYAETISGVATIRAFGNGLKMSEMLEKIDNSNKPWYWLWTLSRWLSGRFNFFSSCLIGCTALVIVAKGNISASKAGFALAFAMTVSQNLILAVRRLTSLEQSMVALERVKEYSELPSEADEYVEPRPPATWPDVGEVQFENFNLAYAPELPLVLKDINLKVPGKSKVGIVGPTGCGKSTLASAFFRFTEAASGKLTIDGIDVSTIGLTDLRSRLQIVPQDPTIMSGTLREALDLYNQFSDEEILEALRRVHLIDDQDNDKKENKNVFVNLNTKVDENGQNFSSGERQLLVITKAILNRSKVIIFDESTSAVDYKTDELIQRTIREEFGQSTIFTIAHRLRTVIDYDLIAVMDNGNIVELASPSELLSQTTSRFFKMCKATGSQEFSTLRKIANESD